MKTLVTSNAFAKDLKKVSQYQKFDAKKLAEYLSMLQRGERLPSSTKDHQMAKQSREEFKNARDFHLSSNICVVYRITSDELILLRIGSHQDLHLTENLM